MCPYSELVCSIGRNSGVQPNIAIRLPKRKQGICLRTNPVLQSGMDQFELAAPKTPVESTSDGYQSVRNRRSCEFITFKGLSNSQYCKELEGVHDPELVCPAANQQVNGLAVIPSNNLAFKMVVQDDSYTVDLDDTKEGKLKATQQSKNSTARKPDPKRVSGPSSETDGKSAEVQPPFKFAGIIGCLIASLFFSTSILCVKLLPNGDTIQGKMKAMWFSGIFLMILCAVAIIYQKTTFLIKRDEIWLNVARSCIGFFGLIGSYSSLMYITIGESTALTYSSPVWTSILGYFILGEALPLTLFLAVPLGLVGIIMIAEPDLILSKSLVQDELLEGFNSHHQSMIDQFNSFNATSHTNISSYMANASSNTANLFEGAYQIDPDYESELYLEQRWPGIIIALATSVAHSFVMIVLKFRKSTPIQTVTFYLGVSTFIISTTVSCFIGFAPIPDSFGEWSILIAMGVSTWLGQAMLQWSIQYEKASVLSFVRTIDVVISFACSAVFLGEEILWTSIVGGVLIMIVVAVLIANESVEKLLCSRSRE